MSQIIMLVLIKEKIDKKDLKILRNNLDKLPIQFKWSILKTHRIVKGTPIE